MIAVDARKADGYETSAESGLECAPHPDLPVSGGVHRAVGFHIGDARRDFDVDVRNATWDVEDVVSGKDARFAQRLRLDQIDAVRPGLRDGSRLAGSGPFGEQTIGVQAGVQRVAA